MEFDNKELEMLEECLRDKNRQLLKDTMQLENLTWENLTSNGEQEMYINKEAFYKHKEMLLNTLQSRMDIIDRIIKKLFKEI